MLTHLRALSQSELGRRLSVATASGGLIWAFGTLATFFVGLILARTLGPQGYGIYGTVIGIVSILAVLAQLGLPILATREVSKARAQGLLGEVAGIGWRFVAMVGAASLVLVLALWLAARVFPFEPTIASTLTAASPLLPALALETLVIGLMRGREMVIGSQLLDVLVRPLAFAALLLAWSELGVESAIDAQTIVVGAITLVGFTLFLWRLPTKSAGRAQGMGLVLAAALPITLFEGMRVLEGNYAVLLTSALADTVDAGLLRVAIACSLAISIPISLQNIIMAPFLAGAHAAGEAQRLAMLVATSTVFTSLAVGLAVIGIIVLGRWALPLAFGRPFAAAYWPFVVLGFNQLLYALLGPGVLLLSMTGHEHAVARAFVISVSAAIVAGLALTALYGAVGAAASMLVATALRAMILNRHAKRTLGIVPSFRGAVRHLRAHRASLDAPPPSPPTAGGFTPR
jgi:O-antigen/teichoic acid export membrane protein